MKPLNTKRFIMHCVIGCAAAHLAITNFFKQNFVPEYSRVNFEDWIDSRIWWLFIAFFGWLLSLVTNYAIEWFQAYLRKSDKHIDVTTVKRAALIGGIPAGILWGFTRADSNDLVSSIIDLVIIVGLAVYYFWDLKRRNEHNV